ncbi:MAG: hypothetical protein RR450_07890, partial [Oscillospiraceae bacterium]
MSSKKVRTAPAYLLAAILLTGLAFARAFSIFGGLWSGKILGILAVLAAGTLTLCVWRFDLFCRYCLPWTDSAPVSLAKNLLVAGPAFILGGQFDLTFSMFDATDLLVGTPLFRVWSGLGSGLVFAVIALALVKAARDFGRLDTKGVGRQMLILALCVNIVAGLYCGTAATVYVWDNAGYWTVASQMAAAPLGIAQLREVLFSTITMEYNQLLAFPISLIMRVLGSSRTVFVFATVNLYLLPGLFGICLLAKGRKNGGLLLTLLTPMLTYLAILGFVDVAAGSVAIFSFYIYTQWDRNPAARGVLAGCLLMLTFLLRRYFLFFALSFGVAALVVKLITERRKWADFVTLFISCGVTSLFFLQSFLVDKLTTSYGDLYSAYALGLRSDMMLFCRYFGLVILALALFSGIFLLIRRRDLRPTMILALVQCALCFFLLTRVQSHGQQHLLLYLPAVLAILAAVICEGKRLYIAWCLAGVTTVLTLLPTAQPASIGEIRYPAPLPSFTFASPQREDIAQLVALRSFVDGLSAGGEKSAAVVSSSLLFNGDTYQNIYPSMGIPQGDGPKTRMIYMGTVDKRDGFSWNVLTADYLLVPDPVQTHLGEENQQVMALLAHDILDGVGMGTAYQKLETSFTLTGDMTVFIFERTREITQEERQTLSARLTALYPAYAQLY